MRQNPDQTQVTMSSRTKAPLKATLALAGALFMVCAAAQQAPALVQPAGSSLALATRQPKTQATQFSGSVVLHGVLVARWRPSGPPGRGLKAHFHLLPTPESQGSLPHFEGHLVSHLSINQGMKVLAQASSPSIAREFAHRKRLEVHAEGLFSLRHLQVDAACLAHATARVEQVDPIGVSFEVAAIDVPSCSKP
jgi:hypothetical protein